MEFESLKNKVSASRPRRERESECVGLAFSILKTALAVGGI